MDHESRETKPIRVLLTIMALEFFGPALRDAGPSHATNPDWVGHARVHVVWFIAMMVALGVLTLMLIWGRRSSLRELRLALAIEACVFAGFWTACGLAPVYGGLVAIDSIHTQVLGIDENVLFFSVMSVVWGATAFLLARLAARGESTRTLSGEAS